MERLADVDLQPESSFELMLRGQIHITSPSPYVEPFFDSGFMNNKADFAPIRWSYKKTREVARRMDGQQCPPPNVTISRTNFAFLLAFRGELTSHHPHFHPASPAAARDIDIKTAKQMMPNGFTVGIHMGSLLTFSLHWSVVE